MTLNWITVICSCPSVGYKYVDLSPRECSELSPSSRQYQFNVLSQLAKPLSYYLIDDRYGSDHLAGEQSVYRTLQQQRDLYVRYGRQRRTQSTEYARLSVWRSRCGPYGRVGAVFKEAAPLQTRHRRLFSPPRKEKTPAVWGHRTCVECRDNRWW